MAHIEVETFASVDLCIRCHLCGEELEVTETEYDSQQQTLDIVVSPDHRCE